VFVIRTAIPNVYYQSLDSSYLLAAISTGDGVSVKVPSTASGLGTPVPLPQSSTSSSASSASKPSTSSSVPSESREQAATSTMAQNNVSSSAVIHPLTSVLMSARKHAPALVFIDDLDLIGCKRDVNESSSVTKMRALLRVEIVSAIPAFTSSCFCCFAACDVSRLSLTFRLLFVFRIS
jgi:hypothetical protein